MLKRAKHLDRREVGWGVNEHETTLSLMPNVKLAWQHVAENYYNFMIFYKIKSQLESVEFYGVENYFASKNCLSLMLEQA